MAVRYIFSKAKGQQHAFVGVSNGEQDEEEAVRSHCQINHWSDIQKIGYDHNDTMYFCVSRDECLSIPELHSSMLASTYGSSILKTLSL